MAEKIQIIEDEVFIQLKKLDEALVDILKIMEDLAKKGAKISAAIKMSKDYDEFLKWQEEAKNNTQKLTTAQKELNKVQRQIEIQEAKLSTAYIEEAKKLAEKRDLVKKSTKENIEYEDSIKGVGKRLSDMKKQYTALSKEQRENTEAGKAMLKNIQALDSEYKELNKSIGQAQLNVGNYKEDVKAAISEMDFFGQAQTAITQGFQKAQAVIKIFGSSLKTALIGTGIGALVIALGAVYTFITKTQTGSEKLRTSMAGLQGIGNKLTVTFAKLGEKIVDNSDKIVEGFVKTNPVILMTVKSIGLADKALMSISDTYKKWRDEINKAAKDAAALEKINIAYEKINMQAQIDIANLEKKKSLQEIIADDNTRDFATRQAAAQETIKLETEINDLKIANAQAELSIAEQAYKQKGLYNKDEAKRINELKIAVIEAETQKTVAIENAAKRQREVDRDLFEQKLDNVLDVYDRNKTVIEQQLQDETLSIEQRKKLTNDLIEADKRNQAEIEQLYLEQTDKKINLNELLKIDNVNTLNEILQNELKFDEIERNRLREVYMERRQYTQDLMKLRREADGIELIENNNNFEKKKEIQQKETDELVLQFQKRVEKQIEHNKTAKELTDEEIAKIEEKYNKILENERLVNETLAMFGESRLNNLQIERERELRLAGDNKEKQKKINEKYDKEEAKIKRRQAIREKAQAIFELGLLLAKQIAMSQYFKAAITTAQITAIAIKKIPEFAKGVIDFKGGEAIVGEKGREILLDRTGKAYLSPDQATLTNLPAGASVIPNNETERILAQMPVHQQRVKEFKPRENALILELLKSNKRLENVIKRKKFVGININEKGFSSFMQQENSKTNVYSSYFRSKV